MRAFLLIVLMAIGYVSAMHVGLRHESKRTLAMEPAIVAIIDTGLSASFSTRKAKLCATGHRNFTSVTETRNIWNTIDPVPIDNHGHGTNIAGLIQTYAGESNNYCLLILKYYDSANSKDDTEDSTIKAIDYATKIGAKYINYSSGGVSSSREERRAVKEFLDSGGKFIAAAGNEKSDLALNPYYPAMIDDRVIVVGSIEPDGKIANYSNWGIRVNRWELGSKRTGFGVTQSGTSQATAVATGKIVRKDLK